MDQVLADRGVTGHGDRTIGVSNRIPNEGAVGWWSTKVALTLTSPSVHTGMGAGSGSGLARSQARAGEGPATRPLLNQTLRNQDAPSAATSTLRRRALILASVSAADDSKEVRTPIPGGDHSYSAGQNIFERMAGCGPTWCSVPTARPRSAPGRRSRWRPARTRPGRPPTPAAAGVSGEGVAGLAGVRVPDPHRAGGFGKTTLARMVAHDPRVRE
jgi:hypothetical protein